MYSIKKLWKRNEDLITEEISGIERIVGTDFEKAFNRHKVTVKDRDFTSFDAKRLNLYFNQTGRGNLRYLHNDEGWFLAEHKKKGSGMKIIGPAYST